MYYCSQDHSYTGRRRKKRKKNGSEYILKNIMAKWSIHKYFKISFEVGIWVLVQIIIFIK